MSSEKFVALTLALVACAVCYIAAAPTTTFPPPRAIDLEKALNHTVCPIRVEIDENPYRIPRRIKTLKCADNPRQWCKEHQIPLMGCCARSTERHIMECVEVHDQVIVKYPNRKENQLESYTVAVGCTCLVSKPNEASTFAPPT